MIVCSDSLSFDVNHAEDNEVGCVINSTSLYPLTESAHCVDIQSQISSHDVQNASEPVYIPPCDGNLGDEHAK